MEILIPAAVILGIIAFALYASKNRAKVIKEREERMARSTHGRAKVLSSFPAEFSGTRSGGKYQEYDFTLEISDGFQPPYQTNVIWEVYPAGAAKVQKGMELDVRIDSEDKMIVYPDADGITFSWNGLMKLMAQKIK